MRIAKTRILMQQYEGAPVDDRILEIVFFLMDRMRENSGQLVPFHEVSSDLKDLGYSDDEISVAFNWFADRVRSAGDSLYQRFPQLQSSQRILTAQERLHITTEAYGILVNLWNLGLIDNAQFEMVLDKAQVYGVRPVSEEQIKWLATRVITGEFQSDDPHTASDVDLTSSNQFN